MKKIPEVELAEEVVSWLEKKGWEVYQEVELTDGAVRDILAVNFLSA